MLTFVVGAGGALVSLPLGNLGEWNMGISHGESSDDVRDHLSHKGGRGRT